MTVWAGTDAHNHGHITLVTPAAITLVTPGQYYKIPGAYLAHDHAGFLADETGKLVHVDVKGVYMLNGTSDVEVNKACQITYALFLNGVLAPGAESPHTFAASSKIDTLAITAIIHLVKGDYLEVYAKTDTASALLTPSTLQVTLFGARI
jgi:hypothetical protein